MNSISRSVYVAVLCLSLIALGGWLFSKGMLFNGAICGVAASNFAFLGMRERNSMRWPLIAIAWMAMLMMPLGMLLWICGF